LDVLDEIARTAIQKFIKTTQNTWINKPWV
jgi:hypothetical protein